MYKVFDFSFDTSKFPTVDDVKSSILAQIQSVKNDSDLPASHVEVAVPSDKEGKTRGFGYLYFSDYKLSELVVLKSESKSNKSWPTTPTVGRKMTSSWADEVDEETITDFTLGGFHISQHELSIDKSFDTHIVMTKGKREVINELYPEILRRLKLFSTTSKHPLTLNNRDEDIIVKRFEFDRNTPDGYYAMLFMRVSYYESQNGPCTLVFIHPKRRNY